jgi:hypothetical protein
VSEPPALLVAPCDAKAARFACLNWHYAKSFPVSRSACYGVWESGRFVGAVIFAKGATPWLASPYGLKMVEVAELVRVALRDHEAPVSQIVMAAVALLRERSPGLRLLISFADPLRGHHGGIYQAMNWLYLGGSKSSGSFLAPDGRLLHRRAYTGRNYGRPPMELPPGAREVNVPHKHRYALPLDARLRRRLAKVALPYPHAVEGSRVSRSAHQPGGVGSTPTDRSTGEVLDDGQRTAAAAVEQP